MIDYADAVKFDTIFTPWGDPFAVPAGPPETRRICEGLSRLLWEGGEYDHHELPVAGIRRVVDVGGGWGAFAVWARWRWGSGIELDIYEPHARGCDFIRHNDARARVHQVAVTVRGEARLLVNDDWGASSTHFNDGRGVDVPVLHPDKLPEAEVLKIDAEGVEPEILDAYDWWDGLQLVAYEWHTPEHRALCRQIVTARGGMRCLADRDGPWGPGNGTALWVPS